jgi:hypothetical protein
MRPMSLLKPSLSKMTSAFKWKEKTLICLRTYACPPRNFDRDEVSTNQIQIRFSPQT